MLNYQKWHYSIVSLCEKRTLCTFKYSLMLKYVRLALEVHSDKGELILQINGKPGDQKA